MRFKIALIGSILAAVACWTREQPRMRNNGNDRNNIVITVTCNSGHSVVGTPDPWVAHALRGEPIIWNLDSISQVDDVTIDRERDKPWPFVAAPPYTVTKHQSVSQLDRDPSWKRGDTAHYAISGSCNGMKFNYDPDMIVN